MTKTKDSKQVQKSEPNQENKVDEAINSPEAPMASKEEIIISSEIGEGASNVDPNLLQMEANGKLPDISNLENISSKEELERIHTDLLKAKEQHELKVLREKIMNTHISLDSAMKAQVHTTVQPHTAVQKPDTKPMCGVGARPKDCNTVHKGENSLAQQIGFMGANKTKKFDSLAKVLASTHDCEVEISSENDGHTTKRGANVTFDDYL